MPEAASEDKPPLEHSVSSATLAFRASRAERTRLAVGAASREALHEAERREATEQGVSFLTAPVPASEPAPEEKRELAVLSASANSDRASPRVWV